MAAPLPSRRKYRRRLYLDADMKIALVCVIVTFIAGVAAGFVAGVNW